MKTTSDKTQKPQKKRRSVGMRKKSTAAYSAYIYKVEKVNVDRHFHGKIASSSFIKFFFVFFFSSALLIQSL